MRAHPLPDPDVIFGKIALGNARVIPINAVGMSEMNAGDSVIFGRCAAFYGRCTAGSGNCPFTHDLFGRLVLAYALERCLTYPVAVRPAAEIDLDHHRWLDPDGSTSAAFLRRN